MEKRKFSMANWKNGARVLVDLGIAERISQLRHPGAYDRYKEL